jgi:hypothetical protein
MEIAEDREAMIDGDDDSIAAPRQRLAVDPRPAAALLREAAAVTPEHHRPLAPVVDAWRPDVQVEAVLLEPFRRIRLRGEHVGEPHVLWRLMTVSHGITYAGPRSRLHRRHEPPRSRRRGPVRNPLEGVDAHPHLTADLAGGGVDRSAARRLPFHGGADDRPCGGRCRDGSEKGTPIHRCNVLRPLAHTRLLIPAMLSVSASSSCAPRAGVRSSTAGKTSRSTRAR